MNVRVACEVHTFTRVADFGGGIVPQLNDLPTFHGWRRSAPLKPSSQTTFVSPGGTYRETVDRAGTLKFQCCIHPWMRLEATSRDSNAESK